ncbi:MAG: hypothetical protein C0505_01225 [Leptothrix sp. (in: Bacteria)]|nr:hypothetical protein [Leptothrix sp. (in: b-proteobacteria)]
MSPAARASDAEEVAALLDRVNRLPSLCKLRLMDENGFVHLALESARPGSAARIVAEHASHA